MHELAEALRATGLSADSTERLNRLADAARRLGTDDRGEALRTLSGLAVPAIDDALAVARLAASARTIDHAMHVVAHDLRNPLNAISLIANLLGSDIPLSEDRRRKQISTMKRAAERMRRMLEDLSHIGAIDDDNLPLEIVATAPSDLVARAAETVDAEASEKSIAIRRDVAVELPTVAADARLVGHVLVGLLADAVRLAPDASEVVIGAAGDDRGVRVFVRDERPRIEPEDLPYLLGSLRNPDRKRKGEAAVMLAAAAGIVQAHDSRLDVTSDERGTEFAFTLGAEDADSEE